MRAEFAAGAFAAFLRAMRRQCGGILPPASATTARRWSSRRKPANNETQRSARKIFLAKAECCGRNARPVSEVFAFMGAKEEAKPIVILLIENDENDVFIFRRALASAGYNANVRVVGSVTEARGYMENAPPYEDKAYYPPADVIVSDYRLAGPTAMEFIHWVKGNARHAGIPIVVISGAASQAQQEHLNELGVAGFISKTGNVADLGKALSAVLPPPAGA
jgi:CheY-like chemotaxis protein